MDRLHLLERCAEAESQQLEQFLEGAVTPPKIKLGEGNYYGTCPLISMPAFSYAVIAHTSRGACTLRFRPTGGKPCKPSLSYRVPVAQSPSERSVHNHLDAIESGTPREPGFASVREVLST